MTDVDSHAKELARAQSAIDGMLREKAAIVSEISRLDRELKESGSSLSKERRAEKQEFVEGLTEKKAWFESTIVLARLDVADLEREAKKA